VSPLRRAWAHVPAWVARFAFAPARPEPLAALRIGVALVLLAQAALVAPSFADLFLPGGIVNGPLREMMQRPGLPHLDTVVAPFAGSGVDETTLGTIAGATYVLALLALLAGLGTRAAALVACLMHLALMTTGAGTNYGADHIAHLFLFYLVFAPSGDALSVDQLLRRERRGSSPEARLALRVVQLQLCVVYATGGLGKLTSPGWRDGDVIWRALMTPEYARFGFDFAWLAAHPWLAVAAGWSVLVVEVGYTLMIWSRRTRPIWVGAVVALHLGIAVFMGLVIFGALMIVLTIAAFAVRADPDA
jgi:hypothetical protein